MKQSSLCLMAVMIGVLAVGCSQKKRIEGSEVPTQPQSNEVIVPPSDMQAPPPSMETEAPPVPEVATPEPQKAEAPAPPPPPPVGNKSSRYLVVRGDTLWGIAGMDVAYRDNFQWPLIFKANRDQITDPDLIYPKQEFMLRKDYPQEDVNKARKDASDTPKYVPHTKPRETLPVDYF